MLILARVVLTNDGTTFSDDGILIRWIKPSLKPILYAEEGPVPLWLRGWYLAYQSQAVSHWTYHTRYRMIN